MTQSASADDPTAAAIAAALVAARREARPLAEFPGLLPASLDVAYAIQSAAIALRRGTIAGWKVGRIWPPLDQQFNSDRLAGPIYAAGVVSGAGDAVPAMPVFVGGFGAVEAEFVFRLGNVPRGQRRFSLADAAACVAAVHVGIEIASSPLAAINDLGPAVTVSDFGNNHGLIVGPQIPDLMTAGIDNWPITVAIDAEHAGSGRSADFPDGALGSVRFLLELLAARGIDVAPGTLVSTGAITGVHAVKPGQSAKVAFGQQYHMQCLFTPAVADND